MRGGAPCAKSFGYPRAMAGGPYGPYRPQSAQNDELARLARRGQQRIDMANDGASAHVLVEGSKNLRVAIGSVRGSPIRRSILGIMFVGFALVGVGILAAGNVIDRDYAAAAGIGFFVAFGSLMTWLFVPPLATQSQVMAERTAIASLPFVMEGYFESLASEPRGFSHAQVTIFWRTSGTDASTLQGLLGLIDTAAQVTSCDSQSASIATGQISGLTGIKINGRPVYRNHGLAKYLRRLIDEVLVPLDRNVGIARVCVSRT
jgi:hypothetical protein